MARQTSRRAVTEHLRLGIFMIVGIVAFSAGRIALFTPLHAVYALLLYLVTCFADFCLSLGNLHLVFFGVDIVAGDTGEVIVHMEGVLPVRCRIVFMAGETLFVLVTGA